MHKYWDILNLPERAKSDHILDVSYVQGDQIKHIPKGLIKVGQPGADATPPPRIESKSRFEDKDGL